VLPSVFYCTTVLARPFHKHLSGLLQPYGILLRRGGVRHTCAMPKRRLPSITLRTIRRYLTTTAAAAVEQQQW
jgi:hypothetical protein